MTRNGKRIIWLLALAAGTAGCAVDRVEESFGDSVRGMVDQQSYGAEPRPDEQTPLEGTQAGKVMEERRKPAANPSAPQEQININISNGD